jgi:thiol-disulfide isomerase/thioredoxin
VAGTVTINGEPAAGVEVRAWDADARRPDGTQIQHTATATTDEAGRYRIERVRPGEVQVGRMVMAEPNRPAMSHTRRMAIEPGGAAQVDFGGGRAVVGRLALPLGLGEGWFFASAGLWPVEGAVARKAVSPNDFASLTPRAPLPLQFDAAYGFRVDDVPAGRHVLRVPVQQYVTQACGVGNLVAEAEVAIDVPVGDHALDVGDVVVTLVDRLRAGDLAPGFELPNVAGGEVVRLADLRGGFVLLDFWATWCGPCMAMTPELKALHQRLGDEVTFVGISFDDKAAAPAAYAARHKLPWRQVHAGRMNDSDVAAAYGVGAIPSLWLIGPDGSIIAPHLRPDQVEAALADHRDAASQ